MGIAALYRKLCNFVLHPWVSAVLIAINLVAGVVGFIYWYGPDMVNYAWWGWIFVPDCPLFSFLFAIALLGIRMGKKWTWFNALVAVGCLKYMIWVVTVWGIYWGVGGPVTAESVIMTLTHIGMGLEGAVAAGFLIGLGWRHVAIVGGWFFLSDFFDYVLGFHPRSAPGVPVGVLAWEMVAVTALLTLWLAWRVWRRLSTHEAKA
jgi:uncharacterized membrane protein YpjA